MGEAGEKEMTMKRLLDFMVAAEKRRELDTAALSEKLWAIRNSQEESAGTGKPKVGQALGDLSGAIEFLKEREDRVGKQMTTAAAPCEDIDLAVKLHEKGAMAGVESDNGSIQVREAPIPNSRLDAAIDVVSLAAPTHARCLTERPTGDATESTPAFTPTAAPTSSMATIDVTRPSPRPSTTMLPLLWSSMTASIADFHLSILPIVEAHILDADYIVNNDTYVQRVPQSRELFVYHKLDVSTPTRCLMGCLLDTLMSSIVTSPTSSVRSQGLLQRPRPWPSFNFPYEGWHQKQSGLPLQVRYLAFVQGKSWRSRKPTCLATTSAQECFLAATVVVKRSRSITEGCKQFNSKGLLEATISAFKSHTHQVTANSSYSFNSLLAEDLSSTGRTWYFDEELSAEGWCSDNQGELNMLFRWFNIADFRECNTLLAEYLVFKCKPVAVLEMQRSAYKLFLQSLQVLCSSGPMFLQFEKLHKANSWPYWQSYSLDPVEMSCCCDAIILLMCARPGMHGLKLNGCAFWVDFLLPLIPVFAPDGIIYFQDLFGYSHYKWLFDRRSDIFRLLQLVTNAPSYVTSKNNIADYSAPRTCSLGISCLATVGGVGLLFPCTTTVYSKGGYRFRQPLSIDISSIETRYSERGNCMATSPRRFS